MGEFLDCQKLILLSMSCNTYSVERQDQWIGEGLFRLELVVEKLLVWLPTAQLDISLGSLQFVSD